MSRIVLHSFRPRRSSIFGSVFQTSPAETGRQGLGLASPIGSIGAAFPGHQAGTLSSFHQGEFVVDLGIY